MMPPLLVLLAAISAALVLYREPSRVQSQGAIRQVWLVVGLGGLLILFVPNRWLQGLLLLLLLNLFRMPDPIHLFPALFGLLAVLGAGVALLQGEQASFLSVPLVLQLLAGMGCFLGLWSLVSWGHWPDTYRYDLGPFTLYESIGEQINCGQENPNNLQAISCVCTAAALGLVHSDGPVWWLVVPVVGMPVLLVQWAQNQWREMRGVTLGPVVLGLVAVAYSSLWNNWGTMVSLGLLVSGGFVMLLMAVRHQVWWDSGRVRTWWVMLLAGWWHGGWQIRLLGRGWSSWLPFHEHVLQVATHRKRETILQSDVLMSTAHNEYVQFLFEHGAVGFMLLCGYLGTTLYRLALGSPEAQAVFLVGVALCGTALLTHPWTWYHGTMSPNPATSRLTMYFIGSPALIWLSWLTVVLAEVVRL